MGSLASFLQPSINSIVVGEVNGYEGNNTYTVYVNGSEFHALSTLSTKLPIKSVVLLTKYQEKRYIISIISRIGKNNIIKEIFING